MINIETKNITHSIAFDFLLALQSLSVKKTSIFFQPQSQQQQNEKCHNIHLFHSLFMAVEHNIGCLSSRHSHIDCGNNSHLSYNHTPGNGERALAPSHYRT